MAATKPNILFFNPSPFAFFNKDFRSKPRKDELQKLVRRLVCLQNSFEQVVPFGTLNTLLGEIGILIKLIFT